MPDPIDVAVGERLRARRRVLKLSQIDLAKQIGVTFQQVQKYERGANRISASMMARAAAALSCSAAELMGEAAPAGLAPLTQEMVGVFESLGSDSERLAVLNVAKALLRKPS